MIDDNILENSEFICTKCSSRQTFVKYILCSTLDDSTRHYPNTDRMFFLNQYLDYRYNDTNTSKISNGFIAF